MGTYIIQVISFQLVFLATYIVFFRKETFFHYNRVYLLVTALLSFIIPFIHLSFLQTAVPVETFQTFLPEVIIGDIGTDVSNSIRTRRI